MLAQEIIRRKRDGGALGSDEIAAFVRGLVDGSWSDAQAAAMAMAVFLQGMSGTETAALTQAMTHSGEVLDWAAAELHGPVVDKHSTGGIGDKTSLLIAPIVAACGGIVPMLSGRGLGHTGGTLDKLDSIPGYRTDASTAQLRDALRTAGCAIVGASPSLAPADRRLYAIRDVTATVESVPLIVASILSKKLAAGIRGLAMDVKVGNGAFAAERPMADALARTLVDVARAAGLPASAWITDMNEVLGHSCGNAVEVAEALDVLRGRPAEPRLLAVVRALSAEMLVLGGIEATAGEALQRIDAVLADGRACERFGGMVAALGGPVDLVERSSVLLPAAPVTRAVLASRSGWVHGMSTREIGLLVVELGGGRRRGGDPVDPRVGITDVMGIGREIRAGDRLATVHAADEAAADDAAVHLGRLFTLGDGPAVAGPVLVARIESVPR